MAATIDVFTGATLTFASGVLGEIEDVSWSGFSREAIQSSHQGTTNNAHTFIPADFHDPGELSLDVHFDADKDIPTTMAAAAETVTLTWPNTASTAANWAASGFLTSFDITGTLNDKIMASATIKLSGPITVTAAV
ncbi:MAG: hypothetical protein ACE5FM_08400 [Methyloligellaceae bacterium]